MPRVDKKSKYFTHYIYTIQISLENRVPTVPEENTRIWWWIEWWYHIKPFTVNLKNKTSFVILLTKYY